MAKETEIKTNVSPTLHPMNITSIKGYEAHKGYVGFVTETMEQAYKAVEHVREARLKLQTDETRTQKARVLDAAKLGQQYLDKLHTSFSCNWDRLTKMIADYERKLNEPVEQYAGIGNVATEIRAHFKGMEKKDRFDFLTVALAKDDERTLKSVLGAPAYLSGLTDLEHSRYVQQYHMKNNPEITGRLEVIKEVRARMDKVRPVMMGEMSKAIGATPSEIARLQATNSAAEAAIVMREFTPGGV